MKAATVGAPVLAVLSLLLVARCVAAQPTHSAADHLAVAQPAVTPVVTASGAAATFNATDVAWLQLLIPMTEQALPVLDAARGRTTDPRLLGLAARMGVEHRAQLRTLRDLLRRSGTPGVNVHEGHNMPGMVTPAELADGERAEGAGFDRFFTEHIGEYLRQSVLVAEGEKGSGADRDTKAFAAAMGRARAGELAQLTSDPAGPPSRTPAGTAR
ncbi:hypothetical protein Misp01_76980 [Microtetraspora sp. NBRC 13810]|uniref:DUF305 domain-containing protein n=1 Tax=Microtetraspora sp. NBRC 13810 TaxID=3030990 RepID=UPI0024A0F0A6|nr:DUF305 domain-containing protein [Microtetraspora sp. NBRC 13810]GLW12570.1 hypothetical protein Misp01_76980 [Microtetraspora sp. NBRC 13810]